MKTFNIKKEKYKKKNTDTTRLHPSIQSSISGCLPRRHSCKPATKASQIMAMFK